MSQGALMASAPGTPRERRGVLAGGDYGLRRLRLRYKALLAVARPHPSENPIWPEAAATARAFSFHDGASLKSLPPSIRRYMLLRWQLEAPSGVCARYRAKGERAGGTVLLGCPGRGS